MLISKTWISNLKKLLTYANMIQFYVIINYCYYFLYLENLELIVMNITMKCDGLLLKILKNFE